MTEPTILRPWMTTAIVHIHPGNDKIEHILDPNCACEPVIEYRDEGQKAIVITHHALDGRQN